MRNMMKKKSLMGEGNLSRLFPSISQWRSSVADDVAKGADCIITIGGIQSNHCCATAVTAKYLNLDSFLILRTSKLLVDQDPGLTGNLLVERLVGAHIKLISKEEYAKVGSVALTNILKGKTAKRRKKPICYFCWWIRLPRNLAKGLGYAINTTKELNFVKEIAATTEWQGCLWIAERHGRESKVVGRKKVPLHTHRWATWVV